MLYFILV